MDTPTHSETAWRLLVCSLVVLSVGGAGLGTVQAQSAPDATYYYGKAVSEAGTDLPAGTVIKAIVQDGGSNRTVDELTMDSPGEYGGSGLGEEKLQIPGDIDQRVYFVAENEFGRFTAAESVQNPDSGTQQLDLTFPPGVAESRPYFEVSGFQPTDVTVLDGETVAVNATVENTGSEQGTQTVSLDIDGSAVETRSVTLGPDSQQTVSFTLDTATLGPGNYTHGISTEDTGQTGSLTVRAKRATFNTSGLDPTEKTVLDGESLNASGTVHNEGNADGTQTVELRAGGTVLASTDVTLASGENQQVTFTDVSTDALAPGTYTYGLFSANDSATGTLSVQTRRANFVVSTLTPPDATLTVGEKLSVSANLSNDGNSQGTQTATFRVDRQEYGSEQLTLGVDEQQTVSFTPLNTSQLGPGTYSYDVTSENDTKTGTLVVESDAPATFTVTDLTPAETTVSANGTFSVSATVTNDGDREATQQVRLQVAGETVDRRAVTLTSGEETTVSFAGVGTDTLGPGTYTYGVFSTNDSATGALTVEGDDGDTRPTATFTLGPLQPATTTVAPGERVDVTTTVSNDGDAEGTQTVRLRRDGEQTDARSVTLAPGEETTVTLAFGTDGFASGSYVYTVLTDDDRQAGSLTVRTGTESTPTPQPSTGTATPRPGGTATPPETQGPQTTDTASTTTESNGGGGGLLPGGLLGAIITYIGIPLLVIYAILKAMAIYLGY